MNEQDNSKTCKCRKVMPWALILIGIAALLADFSILTWAAYNIIWPILVILVGVSKMCKCRSKSM